MRFVNAHNMLCMYDTLLMLAKTKREKYHLIQILLFSIYSVYAIAGFMLFIRMLL